MKLLKLALVLVPMAVLADVGWKDSKRYIGPVRDVECGVDGGLSCERDAGTPVGVLRCRSATAIEPGCVTPSAQSFAGNKTWSGWQRLIGTTHASLTACSAGQKGTWQTCTTHNAPVFCNGTSNIELTGSTDLTALPGVYVNGLFHSGLLVIGSFTLPFDFTITQTSGFIGAGTGAGSVLLRYSDATNLCDCAVDCDSDQTALACTGSCSYAANTLVIALVISDTCTTPPTVKGLLTPAGYRL
jgi:hypothetical protein